MKLTPFSAPRLSKGFSLLEVMVAIAILGISIVAIFQLFSISLRATKKAEDYTKALLYARSMLDDAYTIADPKENENDLEFENGFKGTKEVSEKSSSEDGKIKLYEIIVTVTWPPSGSIKLKGLRTVYDTNK